MTTLEEAVANGRGVERPFRCHVHEDSNASASVNVIKNLWYCYACGAKGTVDGKRVPTVAELEAMLEPEKACREYPSSWLQVFAGGTYWQERFPAWLCWWAGFGEDPFTGDGVFPVHTPRGRLAGVGRRAAVPGPGPKYKYPAAWSASRTLFGSRGIWKGPRSGVLTLVEGAADTASQWEIGVPGWGCYGAGLHMPQVELVVRLQPKLVLLGFDMDEAGERATTQTERMLRGTCEVGFIDWPNKDPAETPPDARLQAILDAVHASEQPALEADVLRQREHVLSTLAREYEKEHA